MINLVKDLRPRFGIARDQGQRPTCLAFATSDAHAAVNGPFEPLSVEYLFYHAVQRMPGKNPHQGINFGAADEALSNEGQPIESLWPYLPSLPADISNWIPPAGCAVLKRSLSQSVQPFDGVRVLLEDGRPVIVVLELSAGFFRPDANGIVHDNDKTSRKGRHAVIAVGHGTLYGGPTLLVRNSWGRKWGLDGHAYLHKSYVDSRAVAISTVS
jgi:hypothetical protein